MAKSRATLILPGALALLTTGQPVLADGRPRDVTLLLRTPSKIVFSYGETMNSPLALRIFFAPDGTAFVEVDKDQVIELPPTRRSASLTMSTGERWTAEISRSPASLKIDVADQQPLAPEWPSASLNWRVKYSLANRERSAL